MGIATVLVASLEVADDCGSRRIGGPVGRLDPAGVDAALLGVGDRLFAISNCLI
ncbi:hypothetical protein [Gaiella sp.]|uniref:hypothetical protein n=1 Tax=Gaiella sp. TaxID=2663207 RepID=UPI003266D858